jgi:TIGR03009 family protein
MRQRVVLLVVCACVVAAAVTPSAFGQGRPAPRQTPRDAQTAPVQQPAGPPLGLANPAAAQKKLDQLLSDWEARSQSITSLDAQFIRQDVNAEFNQKDVYVGRALLKSPNLAFLNFDKMNNGKKEPYEQIRCTGKEVYFMQAATSQIHVYPMPADEQKRALEEGPLPFLFNMRAAEAKKRYNMIFRGEVQDHFLIRIQPRLQEDRQAFIQADIALNKQSFMPDVIMLVAPNGKDTQTYDFRGQGSYIKANARIAEANFKGIQLEGWQVVRHPLEEQQPGRGAAPVGRAPAPGGVQQGRRPNMGRGMR